MRATNLAEYLDRVKEIRLRWNKDDKIEVKADAKSIWFRGQHDASWGLSPKLYRREFDKAHEPEIRQEFQSRAVQ